MLKAFESEGMVRRKGTPAALREESWWIGLKIGNTLKSRKASPPSTTGLCSMWIGSSSGTRPTLVLLPTSMPGRCDDRGLCADTFVTHDIPPDSVAVGIPARGIKGPPGPTD